MDSQFSLPRRPAVATLARSRTALIGIAAFAATAFLRGAAPASPDAAPMEPLAAQTLLLDVVRAGDRLVAVGAHGVVVHSEDAGVTWTQSRVPVQEVLTGVSFYDANSGWIVGHGGTVLRSSDGGATWERVSVPVDPEVSFLDVLALDARHVIAVGAYEVCLESRDGGHSWQRRSPLGEKEEFDRVHLNSISSGPSGNLYLAGEYGTLAVSSDKGETWTQLESPYEGSFYGMVELRTNGRLLAYGLRGRMFGSDDKGATWTPAELDAQILIMGAAEGPGRVVVLVGLGGHLFVSHDGARTFSGFRPEGLSGMAAVAFTKDGALVTVGENGVRRMEVPR